MTDSAATQATLSEVIESAKRFRDETVPKSKDIRSDAKGFCDDLIKYLEGGGASQDDVLDILDEILERFPDVDLREKIKNLIEVVRRNGDLPRHQVFLRI